MTTILAASVIVLFAILIAVCVFGYLRLFAWLKDEEEKDEVKTQPGPYHNVCDFDVRSMHPSSCVSVKPFPGYTSEFQADVSNKIQDRIDQKANEVVHFMNERFDNVYEDINTLDTRFDLLDTSFDNRDEEISKFEDRIEKLEKLVQQLYSDRDEDVNKEDQIEIQHEEIIKKMYEKPTPEEQPELPGMGC